MGQSSQGAGSILQMVEHRAGMQEDVCESECQDEHPSRPSSFSSSCTVSEAHLGSSQCTFRHTGVPRKPQSHPRSEINNRDRTIVHSCSSKITRDLSLFHSRDCSLQKTPRTNLTLRKTDASEHKVLIELIQPYATSWRLQCDVVGLFLVKITLYMVQYIFYRKPGI